MAVSVGTPSVPFVDLGREHAPLAGELRAAFDRVVGASAFTLGAEVEAFESEWATACDAPYAIGVASGTAALALALRAAGVGRGDEVIVPAHTFIASALAVVHAGAVPVFCDVEPDTGLIDAGACAAAITERTAAIIAVHLYGQVCDMDALGELARGRGLLLVEDAAQAHGATWRGWPAGSLGDLGCFSFYPSKNLGALGDGGAVVTTSTEYAERLRWLRNLGQRAKGEHVVLGDNLRLHGLQAALLRVKLPQLAAGNAARRRHAARYREVLPGAMRIVAERAASPSVHHVLAVRVDDRDAVAAALGGRGVQTGVHYHPAAHAQPPFALHRPPDETVPNACAWAAEQLSLPMFPGLTDHEIDLVGDACHAVMG